jgi:hypothetical protein
MPNDERKQSDPLQLLEVVWRGVNRQTSFSYERLNHAMAAALRIAVGGGMRFDMEDAGRIERQFDAGHWLGSPHWESQYALAALVDNTSALHAIEHHLGREPFIADDVDVRRVGDRSSYGHRAYTRKRCRLAVGFKFTWRGEAVTVTSFNDEAGTLTACAYEVVEPRKLCESCCRYVTGSTTKVSRRFTISPADIRAERAERKAAAAGDGGGLA